MLPPSYEVAVAASAYTVAPFANANGTAPRFGGAALAA
jgi:hypothetical protein